MLWIIIPILVVVIDQIAKNIVVKNIATDQMIPVIDKFFYLTLHKNPGAAWGLLQNSRIFFLIIIPIISVVVIYFMAKNNSRFLRFSLALILGGAAGNYIDRLLEGNVTDFLLFYIGSYPFPIFNAADTAITCGTILLAIYMLFIYKEPIKKNGNKEKNQVELKVQYELNEEVKGEAESEVRSKVESVVKGEIESEVKNEVKSEITGELKDAE